MAWPSGTKASTDNCDQPSDLIANARADIKQNIDNVNDVIDTFNIASPSDGDLLQYSSSTGKFEPVAASAVSTVSEVMIKTTTMNANSANDQIPLIEIFDSNSIATFTANTFTLPAGNYVMYNTTELILTTSATDSITLRNETDGSDIGVFVEQADGAAQRITGFIEFTLASTKELSLTVPSFNRLIILFRIVKVG